MNRTVGLFIEMTHPVPSTVPVTLFHLIHTTKHHYSNLTDEETVTVLGYRADRTALAPSLFTPGILQKGPSNQVIVTCLLNDGVSY